MTTRHENKISDERVDQALDDLITIPYFPREDGARAAIMDAILGFVGGKKEFIWLIDTAKNSMRRWAGIAELRALYCTRHTPADGIPAAGECLLPGFTPDDSETAYARDVASGKFLPEPGDTLLSDEDKAEFNRLIDRKVALAFISPAQGIREKRRRGTL